MKFNRLLDIWDADEGNFMNFELRIIDISATQFLEMLEYSLETPQ